MEIIATIFLNIIVGTAFVYDMYYRRIPNLLVLFGYVGMLPIVFWHNGLSGIAGAAAGIVIPWSGLMVIYLFRGLGAGDIKMMCLISGFLGLYQGIKYIILTIFIAGLIGIIKLITELALRVGEGKKIGPGKTTIRFMIPILLSYMVILITKGGIM